VTYQAKRIWIIKHDLPQPTSDHGKFVLIAHHNWKWGVMGKKLVTNKWNISKCVFSQWRWKYELKHFVCLLIMACLFIVKLGLKRNSWIFGWDFVWKYMKLTIPCRGIIHFGIHIYIYDFNCGSGPQTIFFNVLKNIQTYSSTYHWKWVGLRCPCGE